MTAVSSQEPQPVGHPPGGTTPLLLDHPTTSRPTRLASVLLWCTVRPFLWGLSLVARVPLPDFVVSFVAGLIEFGARFVVLMPRGTRFTDVRLTECPARWYLPPGVVEQPDRAVLYFHGGAFITCGVHTHKRLVAQLGQSAGAGVLFVDYGQLPYHTIDDSVRQCVDGYRWLLDQGWAPEKIVFAGDSAGGFLVFAAALRVREEGLPLPAGLVAMAPFTDWDFQEKLAHPNLRRDGLFSATAAKYLPIAVERGQRRAAQRGPARSVPSLFESPLNGLPPSLIHVSSSEFLLPDAEKLASALAQAGVPTTLKTWAGQVHVFQAIVESAPEAKASLRELGKFIQDRTTT